ncbi:MAG: AraC family transcriptional regulator [Chryseolinea sp.]
MTDKTYPKIYVYRRIVQSKMFIDSHYADPIDLDNISDEAAFSKFHFIRLFKNVYGMTPHTYLKFVRIEKAKEFISTGMPISEACSLVGFESSGSFTTLFKKMVGLTPSAFQIKQLRHKSEIISKPLRFIPNCFAESNGWTN